MKKVDYIALSIPVFFLLIFVELAVSRWRKKQVYRFSDTLADLGCGVVQQIGAVFWGASLFAGYVWLYQNYRALEIPANAWWAWLGVFFGVEFFYYWFHRLSHEINFIWGTHVVHHQSEEYNLAVALRQSAFQPLMSWFFYLPLALIGFPPLMFGVMTSFTTLYQFWLHTRFIGKLGPIEWIFNTPSHHRVHHGRNPEYIDRNHGGTLIIYDRIFGTFEPERAEVVYGVTEPVKSWNPVWAQFHYYRDLWRDARGAKSWLDKLKIWFMPPGWKPPSNPAPEPRSIAIDAPKYDLQISAKSRVYVFIHFLIVLLATIAVIFMKSKGPMVLLPYTVLILASFTVLGGLLDGSKWARSAEPLRVVAALAVLSLVFVS
jgi:alkylglycerol monooxygenase